MKSEHSDSPSVKYQASSIEQMLSTLSANLLSQRNAQGIWEGHLSSSALSTATALFALAQIGRQKYATLIDRGLRWLGQHQNADGGWGDTVDSPSNLSTSLLCYAALTVGAAERDTEQRCETYLKQKAGSLAATDLVKAVDSAYGKDKTFSVPILTMCALSGRLGPQGWTYVHSLPFELAALPRCLFRWLRLSVVSYALPALIAIGQVKYHHHPPRCPVKNQIRKKTRIGTLNLLTKLQPENGGFLEAAPLTSFVAMSLAACELNTHPVVTRAADFLVHGVREDGSWPIDTNLATWVTTQSIQALAAGGRLREHLDPEAQRTLATWLLETQHRQVHPYTESDPGAWAWSSLAGAVPDADDTAGALIALHNLAPKQQAVQLAAEAGVKWLLGIQNSDGGFPTFCRGWNKLPFDRSCPDITAHAYAALHRWQGQLGGKRGSRISRALKRALVYLEKEQHSDGFWLPLWFGNQQAADQANPVYGTSRVISHLAPTTSASAMLDRASQWLLSIQNVDGGWGGDRDINSSIEETALALEALTAYRSQITPDHERALQWLFDRTELGHSLAPTPLGLYFARLWYYETMYPLVFCIGALERLKQRIDQKGQIPS